MLETPLTEIEIEKNLDKLEVSKLQQQIIQEKGEIMSKILDMASLSVRGFFVLALVEWQKQVGMTVKESESPAETSREQRKREAEEIFVIFRKKIARVLTRTGKFHLLDEAIETALRHYVRKYADRSLD